MTNEKRVWTLSHLAAAIAKSQAALIYFFADTLPA
jgi:hypothetical protein